MYSILVPRIYSVMNILYQLEVSGQRVGLSLHKFSRLPSRTPFSRMSVGMILFSYSPGPVKGTVA